MKNVMIVGPGRSGTSMVAGLFESAGYFFGRRLYSPSKHFNPKGFFEDPEINKLNEKLLNNAGVYYPTYRPDGTRRSRGQCWLKPVANLSGVTAEEEQVAEIKRLIGQATEGPFCYKDPRFCYTLQCWLPYLDLSQTVFVCIVRHPDETASSLQRYCKGMWKVTMTVQEGISLWACMFDHIIDNHRKRGRWLFLDFGRLIGNNSYRQAALDRLDGLTGATVDRSFINPSLRTQKTTNSKLHEPIMSQYQRILQLTDLSD